MPEQLLCPLDQEEQRKRMPTDQTHAKGAAALTENQDLGVDLQGEPPEQFVLRHASSSESITDSKRNTERLPTYEEVDETEEGIRAAEAKRKTGVVMVQPLQQGESGVQQENSQGHHDISATETPAQPPQGSSDDQTPRAAGESDPQNSQNPANTDQIKETNDSGETADKNGSTAESHVLSLNDEGEKSLPKGEGNSDTHVNESTDTTSTVDTKKDTSSTVTESFAAKAEQPEGDATTNVSKQKTPRVMSAKPNSARQGRLNNARDTDQKFTKRPPSAVGSRSPRTTETRNFRSLIEKHRKQTGRLAKLNDKSKDANNKTSTASEKPKSATSKLVNNTATKPGSGENPNTDPHSAENTKNQTSDSKKHPAGSKPANGIIQTGSGKDKELTDAAKEKEEQEQKAQALLSKAVMRRLASLDANSNQTTAPQAELNSSAGSKSLSGSTPGDSQPRPAHKTQSMRSLAVPAPGTGLAPSESDDRASLGSRRDSVRLSIDSVSRKSVDYRLQTANAVVTVGGVEEKPRSMMMHDDSMIRAAIPAMSVSLAVACLVLNIILPGTGTIVSGFSVLCGSKCRLSNKTDTKATAICVNLCVGAAQAGTITFLFVGWFWSLAWGVKMVILAVEHRTEQRQQRQKELQTLALRAFGSPGNLRRSILPPV